MPTQKIKLGVVAFALEVIKYTEKFGAYPRNTDNIDAAAARSLIKRGWAEELDDRCLKATPALFTAFGMFSTKRYQHLLVETITADGEYLAGGMFPPIKFDVSEDGKWTLAEKIYSQRY